MREDPRVERKSELARSYRDSGEQLVRLTRPRLVKLARSRGLDLSAAKDVVQQAFMALFEKRPHLADVEAWLARVVLRRSHDWRRTERRRSAESSAIALPSEVVEQLSEEQRLAVRSVLGKLSLRTRKLVEARYFEGHSEEDAARLAGYSPASYKKTMTRALRKMRQELEKGCAAHRKAALQQGR